MNNIIIIFLEEFLLVPGHFTYNGFIILHWFAFHVLMRFNL